MNFTLNDKPLADFIKELNEAMEKVPNAFIVTDYEGMFSIRDASILVEEYKKILKNKTKN